MKKVVNVPNQVFDFLRDGLIYDLNRHLEIKLRPTDDYLKLIEESIQFIEDNDEFTQTKRIRELFKQVKELSLKEVNL